MYSIAKNILDQIVPKRINTSRETTQKERIQKRKDIRVKSRSTHPKIKVVRHGKMLQLQKII